MTRQGLRIGRRARGSLTGHFRGTSPLARDKVVSPRFVGIRADLLTIRQMSLVAVGGAYAATEVTATATVCGARRTAALSVNKGCSDASRSRESAPCRCRGGGGGRRGNRAWPRLAICRTTLSWAGPNRPPLGARSRALFLALFLANEICLACPDRARDTAHVTQPVQSGLVCRSVTKQPFSCLRPPRPWRTSGAWFERSKGPSRRRGPVTAGPRRESPRA